MDLDSLDTLAQAACRTAYQPQGPPPALPALSVPRTRTTGYPCLSKLVPEEAQVSAMLEAYRAVHKKLTGTETNAFRYGRVSASKYYPRLKSAAELLLKHEIAPGAWAEWVITYNLSKGKPAPGPIQVFSGGSISTRSGWFRKDYRGATGTVWDPEDEKLIGEQLLRRAEAMERWRTGGNGDHVLVGKPVWYVEQRKREMAAGAEDPLVRYPR
jgi:hypothetical protein